MSARVSPQWLYGFLLLQFALQTSLVFPLPDAVRTASRAFVFLSSIACLALLPGRGAGYPLRYLVAAILGIVALELLHPGLNTPLAGLAQNAMYVAIWGPVFWVGRVAITPRVLGNVMLLLWGFHTASAALGMLQVYDPARFAPAADFVQRMSGAYAEGLKVELSGGDKIFRPFGLTDTPGGAAASGSFAGFVGLILVGGRVRILQISGLASVVIGMFCIYLCHVRSILVVTGVSFFGLIVAFAAQGQVYRAARIGVAAAIAAVGGFLWASSVGAGVGERFATLIEEDPGRVYYANRGSFLESTLEEDLPNAPLGTGLGRYGMMHAYFGASDNPDSPPLWVEIQPTAWVYDGGIFLLVTGYAAVVGALVIAGRLAMRATDESLAALAAAVAAFDLSILVNTAAYCNFLSQGGMLFWILNAALYAACSDPARRS